MHSQGIPSSTIPKTMFISQNQPHQVKDPLHFLQTGSRRLMLRITDVFAHVKMYDITQFLLIRYAESVFRPHIESSIQKSGDVLPHIPA